MNGLLGDKKIFALRVVPLLEPPKESDPSAAATWASLEVWVNGRNLCQHVHEDSEDVHQSIQWPLIYLARWLTLSWQDLFEKQRWPSRNFARNTRSVAFNLDEQIIERPDDDQLMDIRDAFIQGHSIRAGSAGGLVPDIYIGRDGERVSIAWQQDPEELKTRFIFFTGEWDVDTCFFLEVIKKFIAWTADKLSNAADPVCKHDYSVFQSWLKYHDTKQAAENVLLGYASVDKKYFDSDESVFSDFISALGLPVDWYKKGSMFTPNKYGPVMVFRSLSPKLNVREIKDILNAIDELPVNNDGIKHISDLRDNIIIPEANQKDWSQGYELATHIRQYLNNESGFFDIEKWLTDELSITVQNFPLSDPEIDGGAVFDSGRGPIILINPNSTRANAPWGRRMVLAHELCHLLIDYEAAVSLRVLSGPWAPPIIERRANAFAAELLLPRTGIKKIFGPSIEGIDISMIKALQDQFGVGLTTCQWHIKNRFPSIVIF